MTSCILFLAVSASRLAQYVFASACLSSSEVTNIVEKVSRAMQNKVELKKILVEARFLTGVEDSSFETLSKIDSVISQFQIREYEKAITYIPESMRAPLQVIKVAWQLELFKLILTHVYTNTPVDENIVSVFLQLSGYGRETFSGMDDVDKILSLARRMFPIDLIRFLKVNSEEPLRLIQARLDQAFCEYVTVLARDANTIDSKRMYKIFLRRLMDKNILLLARVKYSGDIVESVRPYLLNVRAELEPKTMDMLLEATDYERFLKVLAQSPYSSRLPAKRTMTPTELEEALSNTLFEQKYESSTEHEELIVNITRLFCHGFEQLRQAAYSVILTDKEVRI
ncbi:MAG: V-type ATPase subunit [Candidatus Bathyarchaeia archaeon]